VHFRTRQEAKIHENNAGVRAAVFSPWWEHITIQKREQITISPDDPKFTNGERERRAAL
jgi:hypothetical protein